MVKIPPGNFLIPHRGVSIRGQFYSRIVRGQVVYSKWPRRQPTPRTPKEADNRKLLEVATIATKYMSAQEQAFAADMAKRAKLLPRDFLMLALFGRLGVFVGRNGVKRYSMYAVQNVSEMLDALWQLKGGILVRGKDWWTGLPPGLPNEVLQMGPDGLPIWSPGGGGGGAGAWFMQPPIFSPPAGAATVGAGAMIGIPFATGDDVELKGLKAWITATGTGRTIQAAIYSDNAYTLSGGTKLGESAGQNPVLQVNQLDFIAPVPLLKDTLYWMCLCVTGGSGNVQFLNMDFPRNNYMYFTQSNTSLPTTAPTATPGVSGYQFNWWAF